MTNVSTTWSSSPASIASVSPTGLVTAESNGSVHHRPVELRPRLLRLGRKPEKQRPVRSPRTLVLFVGLGLSALHPQLPNVIRSSPTK